MRSHEGTPHRPSSLNRRIRARSHSGDNGSRFANTVPTRGILEPAVDPVKCLIALVSAEEVILSCGFNGLQWPTCRNGAIEPQKLFPAVANRKLHLKLTN